MSTQAISSGLGTPLRALKRHHLSPARPDTRKKRRLTSKAAAARTTHVTVSVVTTATTATNEELKKNSGISSDTCISQCSGNVDSNTETFLHLPTEVLHTLLSFLDSPSLGALALTSHEMGVAVRNYVYTVAGLKKLLPRVPEDAADVIDPNDFRTLGKLLRDITLLQSLHIRLKTISFFVNKLEPVHDAISSCLGSSMSYQCAGEMLGSYVDGWEDYDKARVYSALESIGKVEQRIRKVLQSGPNSLPCHERDVRDLLRLVFLASSRSDADYGFWLSLILKPWPIVFQARLLYIITGPVDQLGFVSWTIGCGCSTNQHSQGGSVDFTELGRALHLLHQYRSQHWSDDDIISIIDELTTTPSGWCLENVAQLLLHSGSDVIKWVLGNRACNGRVEELSILGYYLAQLCIKVEEKELRATLLSNGKSSGAHHAKGDKVNVLLDVFRYVLELLPSAQDRNHFVSSVIGIWRDYLAALYDDTDPLETEYSEVRDEFHSTLEGLASLSTTLFYMILEQTAVPHQ